MLAEFLQILDKAYTLLELTVLAEQLEINHLDGREWQRDNPAMNEELAQRRTFAFDRRA